MIIKEKNAKVGLKIFNFIFVLYYCIIYFICNSDIKFLVDKYFGKIFS